VNHILVVDKDEKLRGIVTSWDITKAVANGEKKLKNVIVRNVHTVSLNDPIELAVRRMDQHKISALPVIDDESMVMGIVTSEDTSRLFGGTEIG
jgi:CBS domain-containing protein